MRISGIKFVQGGLKGIEVTYRETEQNDRFEYDDEFTIKKKRPVHADFKKAMQAFERHYRLIMGIDERVAVEITGVTAGEEDVMIIAQLRVLNNLRTGGLPTVKIDPDAIYKEYDKLMKCVDVLYSECSNYIHAGKSATPKQFVMDFISSDAKFAEKEGITESDVKKMDEEGQYELMQKILEKKGCIVLAPQNLDEGAEDDDNQQEVPGQEDDEDAEGKEYSMDQVNAGVSAPDKKKNGKAKK